MLKIVIKTIFIVFNVLFLLGASKDFENKKRNPFGYLCWVFLEMIFIMVMCFAWEIMFVGRQI